jgi:coenzyme Q-binding protein COQ10
MARIKKDIMIQSPPDAVYAIARDPNRWSTWFANLSGPEKLEGDGSAGTVGHYTYKMAGLAMSVAVKVLEDSSSSSGCRWVGRVEGAITADQIFIYAPEGDGTRLTVEIDYTVPGAGLGKLADKLVVERFNEQSADRTLKALKQLCERT